MLTIGNEVLHNQLLKTRPWYLGLGIVLVLSGLALLAVLPFATLSVVFLFGTLMMLGGGLHFLAAIFIFHGGFRWFWALFGVLYLLAGWFAFTTPVKTAIVLTNLLGIFLMLVALVQLFNAWIWRPFFGWGWILLSALLTGLAGCIILFTPGSPFWVLGLFLAIDILVQGINYLSLAASIKKV